MTAKQRHRARKWERGDIHPTYTPLPIDTCERLESYASMMGISRADAIRQACAEFLARHHDAICRYEVGTIRSRYDRDTRAIQEAEACRACLDKVTGKGDEPKQAAYRVHAVRSFATDDAEEDEDEGAPRVLVTRACDCHPFPTVNETQAQVITIRMSDAPDGTTRGEEAAPAIPAHEAPKSASQGTPEGKESF